MREDNNLKLLQFVKKILMKIKPRFSFHYIAYTTLSLFVIFSVISIVTATTPNPGHPWSELGDGVFVFTNGQTVTPYTYTFPSANSTVLTTNAYVTVAQGGTGVGTLTGIVKGNGTGAFSVASAGTDYQAPLVSGTSIKTINSTSLLGSGDIAIAGMTYPGSGIPNSTGSAWGTSYTTSGSGTVLALATTPTFTTNITTPLVLGGSATTADLTLQTTSGVGATGADMHFLVGNNGATEAMTILNSGNVGIGTTNPASLLTVNGNALIGATSVAYAADYKLQVVGTSHGLLAATNLPSSSTNGLALSVGVTGEPYVRTNFYSNGQIGFGPGSATRDVFIGRTSSNTIGITGAYDGTGTGNFYVSGNVGIGTTAPTGKLDVQGLAVNDLPTYSAEFLSGSGWTSTDWTGDFATGWTHTVGNTSVLSQSTAAVNATKYQIAYTVTGRTAGSFTIGFGGQSVAGITATSSWGPTTTSTASLTITPTTDFDGTIVISIKSITAVSTPLVNLKSSDGTARIEMRANTATGNTFIGVGAGRYNTTGLNNTTNGNSSLYSNTTGSNNTANGYASLYYNTTGNNNTADGLYSLQANTTGVNNTASGYSSLFANTTASQNTAFGNISLYSNTTGSYNTGLGYASGRFIADGTTANTTSDQGVYIGANTRAGADNNQNEIVIGYNAIGAGSNTIRLGNTSVLRTYAAGLNLSAGTATAGTAPLKLTSGTDLTTPEAGAFEYDGTNLHFTPVATRETIAYVSNLTTGYVPYTGANANVNLGTYSLTTPNILGGTSTTQDLTLQTTSGVGATGADMHFLVGNNGATEAMTILNDGKVGINTIAPNDTLQVKTTGQGSISFGGSNGREIHAYDAAGAAANFDMVAASTYFSGDLVVGGQIKSTSSGNLILATQTAGKGVAIGNITPTANLHIKAGTATANTAPLKFTSGTLLTTPEAGAIEFLTDAYYGTITTGGARKTFAFLESPVFTTNITTPLVLGGTSTTQDLTLQTTSGIGATGADMHFLVGNNGGTEAMTILNSGSVGIGTTSPTYKLDVKGTTAAHGIRSDMGFDIYTVPAPTAPTGVVSAGGSVDTGNHYYWITYTTAVGETNAAISSVITTTAGNNTVTLTIPASTDPRVTGRKLYRTKAGGLYYNEYYLATIANNTDVSYIDTVADSTLTGNAAVVNTRGNTTSYGISVNGTRAFLADAYLTAIGRNAGGAVTSSAQSTYIGSSSGRLVTTGNYNTSIGYNTLYTNVTGSGNTALGTSSLNLTTSNYNTGIGSNTLQSTSTGTGNTALGYFGLFGNTTGSYNVALGYRAARFHADGTTALTDAENSVYIGGDVRGKDNSDSNSIVIGYNAIGMGANTAVWGNTSILNHYFSGNINATNIIGGSSTTQDLTLQTTSGVGATGADMHFLVGNAGGTEAMTILNSGNVGVGTTNPLGRLHLNTDINNVMMLGDTTNATDKYSYISSQQYASTSESEGYQLLGAYSNSTDNYVGFGGGTSARNMAQQLRFYTDPSPTTRGALASNIRMFISGAGYVGIGTITPSYKLDVKGTAAVDGIRSDMGFDIYSVPYPASLSGVVSAGGSVDTGTHYYYVTYTTAAGETNSRISSVITTTAGNNTVTLTIPVSTDPRVTGRKLYRTKAGDASYNDFALATIANNTDVSYVDTVADSTLAGAAQVSFGRSNTTSNFITVQGVKSMTLDSNFTAFGVSAGAALTYGSANSFFGYRAGYSITSTGGNTAVGNQALETATTTTGNTAIGYLALRLTTTGGYNSALGYQALYNNTQGTYNVGMGREALFGNTTGAYNVGMGYQAGRYIADGATANTTSDYSLYLGYNSKAGADNNQNEIVVGYNAIGQGSNTAKWGNTSITDHFFSGDVGISTSAAPTYKLQVGSSSVSGIVARFENSTGTCDINPTTSTLACSSDISLKKNIRTFDDVEFILKTIPDVQNQSTLEKINTLTPVMYNWNIENEGDSKHVGFIAQEMEQLFPELVSTDPDTGLKSIGYANITPYLVKTIQEMNLKLMDINNIEKTNDWRDSITLWFANTKNGITEFVGGIIRAKDKLCIGEGSDEVCITKEELLQIKNNNVNKVNSETVVTPDPAVANPDPTITPETTVTTENTSTSDSSTTIGGTTTTTPSDVVAPDSITSEVVTPAVEAPAESTSVVSSTL